MIKNELQMTVNLYNKLKPSTETKISGTDVKLMRRDLESDEALIKYIVGVTYDGLAYGNWLKRAKK